MTIDYDDFMKEKRERAKKLPISIRNKKRGVKRRQRDPEERKVIFAMIRRRVKKAIESGELEFISPREIRWNK